MLRRISPHLASKNGANVMMPRIGDRAPTFTATLPNGDQASLKSYAGRSVLLIFMRHLG